MTGQKLNQTDQLLKIWVGKKARKNIFLSLYGTAQAFFVSNICHLDKAPPSCL